MSQTHRLIYFFLIHLRIFLLTLMKVPFIPKERDSITPALSNLRSAFTITDLVIPTLSATFDAINRPSYRQVLQRYVQSLLFQNKIMN